MQNQSITWMVPDIINAVIACIALFLSLSQWIYSLWKSRYHFLITNTGYYLVKAEANPKYRSYTFGFFVENLSSNPLNILYFSVLLTNGRYERCLLTHRFLKEHFIPPGLDNPYRFFSNDFPIHLDGNCSKLIYVNFVFDDDSMVAFSDAGKASFMIVSDRKCKTMEIYCTETTNFLNQ